MTGAGAGGRVVLLALALLGGGCAQVEAPPGGPEDKAPPELVLVRPDSVGPLSPGRDPVVFVFDERLSEQTATNRPIGEAVLVSPRTSPVRVEKRGSEIRVELRQGWEPGRIYHVTLTPGIRDLFGNRLTETVRAVLSTGPEIPDTHLTGTVVSRITGRPERDARVEAILRADSSVYALPSDSAGGFRFERIPEGEYLVRAYPDANQNREPDFFEARDTATVTVAAADAPPPIRLRLLAPDTTAPKLASGSFAGSVLRLQFDDHLDPEQRMSAAQVTVTLPDGASLAVTRVNLGEPPRGDTAGAGGRPEGAPPRAAPADTAGPREPLPVQLVTVELAAPPVEGVEYRVVATGFRNLHGAVGGGELTLRGPAAPAPAGAEGEALDSADAAPDTVKAVPGALDAAPRPPPDSVTAPASAGPDAATSAPEPPAADSAVAPVADSAGPGVATRPGHVPAEASPGDAPPGLAGREVRADTGRRAQATGGAVRFEAAEVAEVRRPRRGSVGRGPGLDPGPPRDDARPGLASAGTPRAAS